jgi:hypothetical protein
MSYGYSDAFNKLMGNTSFDLKHYERVRSGVIGGGVSRSRSCPGDYNLSKGPIQFIGSIDGPVGAYSSSLNHKNVNLKHTI